MNPAASERKRKEVQPERFCVANGCLWRLSSGPCRKHMFTTQGWNPPTSIGIAVYCNDIPLGSDMEPLDK
jgi:hypothetical protein